MIKDVCVFLKYIFQQQKTNSLRLTHSLTNLLLSNIMENALIYVFEECYIYLYFSPPYVHPYLCQMPWNSSAYNTRTDYYSSLLVPDMDIEA